MWFMLLDWPLSHNSCEHLTVCDTLFCLPWKACILTIPPVLCAPIIDWDKKKKTAGKQKGRLRIWISFIWVSPQEYFYTETILKRHLWPQPPTPLFYKALENHAFHCGPLLEPPSQTAWKVNKCLSPTFKTTTTLPPRYHSSESYIQPSCIC